MLTKQKEHIIFDLDRTLFDWDQTQNLAQLSVNILLSQYAQPEQFWTCYQRMHDGLFQKFLDQEWTVEQYRFQRYWQPLKSLGIAHKSSAAILNVCFIEHALKSDLFCSGAEDALNACKQQGLKIVLLTNGPTQGQYQKNQNLNLDRWLSHYYISEEQGVAKPNPQAFLNICQQLHVEPQNCLMAGDDLNIDILPAMKLGMQVFWVKKSELDAEVKGYCLTQFPQRLHSLISPCGI